jgi:hypothetical protein
MEHRNQELEIDYQAMQRRTIEMTETHNTLQQNFDALLLLLLAGIVGSLSTYLVDHLKSRKDHK